MNGHAWLIWQRTQESRIIKRVSSTAAACLLPITAHQLFTHAYQPPNHHHHHQQQQPDVTSLIRHRSSPVISTD